MQPKAGVADVGQELFNSADPLALYPLRVRCHLSLLWYRRTGCSSMKKLDSFALDHALKQVDEVYEADSAEDQLLAKQGLTDLLQMYFEGLGVSNETNAQDRLIAARESMRDIIRVCLDAQRTLGYLTRPDQEELCKAFTQILQRIALTADAHFGDIH